MRRAAATALTLALALGGCGGGKDEAKRPGGGARTDTGPSTAARTDTTTTEQERATTAPPKEDAGGSKRRGRKGGEDQPGGAGDEEPARSQAELTGRGGRVSPRVVQVPPFIAIRVELRSADGKRYTLAIAGRTLTAGGPVGSASTTLHGLRSGRAYRGRTGDGGAVKIVASAEPGP